MTRRNRVVATMAAAAAVLAFTATPVSAARTPVLKGRTLLAARQSAVVKVTLPRPARIDLDNSYNSAAVRISGRGRVFGFALVHAREASVVVSGLMFGACTTPGCVPTSRLGTLEMVGVQGARRLTADQVWPAVYEIPRGTYYAHVLTDGSPVSVELRLGGLTGSVSVRPSVPHEVTVRQGEPTLPALGAAYSAGAAAPARGPVTLLTHLFHQRSSAHVEHVSSNCYYHDATPPGGHVAPGCPEGQQGILSHIGYVTTDFEWANYGYAVATGTGDTWYQGVWAEGARGPTESNSTFLWTDLRYDRRSAS